jgi:chromosome segregation ATPase
MLRQELAELETHYGNLLQRAARRVDGLVQENETLKAEYSKLLESSSHIKAGREKEITELRSQLAAERADREEIEGELSDLKQKSATTGKDLPDAAEVYNQFKAEYPKAKTSYKEAVAILAIAQAMIEES